MKLFERFRKMMASIDALSLRERLSIFAATVFVIGGAWEAAIGSSMAAREYAARDSISAIEKRLDLINESVAMAAQGIGGGMHEQMDRLQQLQRSVADSERTMRIFTSDLVDPAQMRFVIEDLLTRHDGLKVISARNLDARPVLEPDPNSSDAESEERPVVYRHGFRLEFEGSYIESLGYLADIERLPWQLFWSRLTLETIEYPRIRIAVEVQTLSLDLEWIGV